MRFARLSSDASAIYGTRLAVAHDVTTEERSVRRRELRARPVLQLAAEALTDLEKALLVFSGWTAKPLSSEGRFAEAVATLQELIATGGLSAASALQAKTLSALELALDAQTIASSLPGDRVADLRRDIETCSRGELTSDGDDRQPQQAQSQLIVRAALFRSGANPTQPTHSGAGGRKKPDVLVENGTFTHAVEVKRPSSNRNLSSRLKDAIRQLRDGGHTGLVVFDATDCLRGQAPDKIDDAVYELAESLGKRVFSVGAGWQPGCEALRGLAVFVRPVWLVRASGGGRSELVVHNSSAVIRLGKAEGTLDHHQAHWLCGHLERGLDLLGISSREYEARASGA